MYQARITRQHQALFLLLVDQSGSMGEKMTIHSRTLTKAEYVAEVANRMISELIDRCRREEGIRDYLRIAAIGYRDREIHPLLGDDFEPLTPSQLAAMKVSRRDRLEERVLPDGQSVVGNFPQTLWMHPAAAGNTPMYEALVKAHEIIAEWVAAPENRASYPPLIINISDGEATDADPGQLVDLAQKIKELSTHDGATLILNIHITDQAGAPRALFPASIIEVPVDRNARTLYEMSSVLPAVYDPLIVEVRGDQAQGPFRGLCYNTPVTDLVAMMNIGSVSVELMQ